MTNELTPDDKQELAEALGATCLAYRTVRKYMERTDLAEDLRTAFRDTEEQLFAAMIALDSYVGIHVGHLKLPMKH